MSSERDAILSAFQRDGFYLAAGLFSEAETAALRGEAHAIFERLNARFDATGAWDTVAAAGADSSAVMLEHCHDAHLHSAAFSRALFHPGLVDLLALFLGGTNVQLHHNKLFVKPPERGAPFPLHQDWPFFPHRNDSPIAAIVHLDAATEEKGCLRAVAGSHRDGRREHLGDSDWYLPPDVVEPEQITVLPAEAGDVLFFSYLTIHGSGPNVSSDARTTWLVQVRDPHDEQTVDRHRSPGQGTMLAGTNSENAPPPTSFGTR